MGKHKRVKLHRSIPRVLGMSTTPRRTAFAAFFTITDGNSKYRSSHLTYPNQLLQTGSDQISFYPRTNCQGCKVRFAQILEGVENLA